MSNVTFSASGKINGCQEFNGSTSNIIVNNGLLGSSGSSFSISVWINPDDVTSGLKCICYQENTNNRVYMLIRINGDNQKFEVASFGTGIGQYNMADSGDYTASISTWYHIVATYDGSNYRIYVDGQLRGTDTKGDSLGTITGAFYIGQYDSGDYKVDGRLDEMGVWNKVLTGSEIEDLYNSGDGLPYD
jgi:hypothetical protein